jgi:tRNA 2-thiouridine synthesizing protein E
MVQESAADTQESLAKLWRSSKISQPFQRGYEMSEIEAAGKTIRIDDEGYLENSADWNPEVAQKLAGREGKAPLTEEQMDIIKFMRNYYGKFHAFPILNQICKNVHQPRECVNEEFINPEKAWKIAGLPKLSGVHFVTMDGKNYIMEECC